MASMKELPLHTHFDEIFSTSRQAEESIPSAPSAQPTIFNDKFIASNDTVIIRETFRVYGSIYLILFCLFCFLRVKRPKLYNIRSWVPGLKTGLAQTQSYGLVSWCWRVFMVSEDDILDNCGMDALCFLRCLRLGTKLSLVGSANALWLIPLYLTAEDSDETSQLSDTFVKISMAHLPHKSPRFVGTIISAYIVVLYAMYAISKEYDWYTRYRHKYLSQRVARNYSIYVSGIPKEFQSSFALADYFRQCISWNDSVSEAHIAMDIPALEAKVAKRDKLVANIEHIMALEKKQGVKKTHRTLKLSQGREGVKKVDTVTTYMKDLDKLNHQIALASGHVSRSNHPMRQHLVRSNEDIQTLSDPQLPSQREGLDSPLQKRSCSEPTLSDGTADVALPPALPIKYQQPDTEASSSSSSLIISTKQITDDEATSTPKTVPQERSPLRRIWSPKAWFGAEVREPSNSQDRPPEDSDEELVVAEEGNGSSRANNSWGLKKASQIGVEGARRMTAGTKAVSTEAYTRMKKAGQVGAQSVWAAGSMGVTGVRRAADFGLQTLQQAPELGATIAAVVPLRLSRSDGNPREAGFVVFKDLFSAQAARQMLQHPNATKMLVEAAPDPEEIFWRNVGLPAEARRSGWLLSLGATCILCLFWSIPMAFLSSLTEVNSLKENLPVLARWIEDFPALESFLELVAPLLLLSLNEGILPIILKGFATWEGHVGASVLEASLFVKLCAFVFIQTFFISALSGTITAELSNILDNPEDIVSLLANSLPAQSSYFIQICFVFTFLLQGLDLVRAFPLGVAFFRRFMFGPRLTAKQRQKRWKGFYSLQDPPAFWHAEILAQIMLFFVVFFVYSSIAPISSIFLAVCFVICESGYRYHFIHNQPPKPDSGGMLYKGFINVLIASMLIGQITLYGLLILKQSASALPALAPLGLLTVLFVLFVVPKRNHVSAHLPTTLCVEEDKRNSDDAPQWMAKHISGQYLQPALRAKPLYPEGVNEESEVD